MFPAFKSPSDPKFLEALGRSYLGRPFILLLKMLPHAGIEQNFLYHQLKMVAVIALIQKNFIAKILMINQSLERTNMLP
jgi:hypothetical protein